MKIIFDKPYEKATFFDLNVGQVFQLHPLQNQSANDVYMKINPIPHGHEDLNTVSLIAGSLTHSSKGIVVIVYPDAELVMGQPR